MTKQLPQDFIDKVLEYDAKRGGGSKSVRPQVFLEVFIRELGPYLSLPKHEECTACYGKGKYSVYKGDAVAGVDFPGDKPFVVEQGGVKEFPCHKCKGKQEQEDTTPIEMGAEVDVWMNKVKKRSRAIYLFTLPSEHRLKYVCVHRDSERDYKHGRPFEICQWENISLISKQTNE